jgi:prepilin-type N-terminal cleavage/methylation domain-containing protein/prepilin-type processing-associated H-X9-DG protein
MDRRTRSRATAGGFTLVELLVVIGIIAVLVAMLLPALNKAKRAAGQAQCASNMKQLATANLQYAMDNKGRLILCRIQASGVSSTYPRGWFWANEMVRLKYLSAPNQYAPGNSPVSDYTVFQCPQGIIDASFTSGPVTLQNALYPTDPKNRLAQKLLTNIDANLVIPTWYQLNARLIEGPTSNNTKIGGPKAGPFVNYNKVRAGADPDAALRDPGYTRSLSHVKKSGDMVMIFEGAEQNLLEFCDVSARHGPVTNGGKDGYTNIAFFDGHVALHPTEQWTKLLEFTPPQNGIYVYLADQR